MSEKELCARDLSILDLLFDQSRSEKNKDEILKPLQDTIDVQDDFDEGSEENVLSKTLEIDGIKLTESAKFTEALNKFNEAIDIAPWRPSVFNNRAQLYRFLGEDEKAIIDLNKAIDLSGDGYKLTKCRAHTQRGIIMRKQNNSMKAIEDFNESIKIGGSKFARQQLVELNPYAQLCNQMVSKLMNDYQTYLE